MTVEKDELIKYRIERAFDTLEEANLMIINGFLNAAVNRTYYACYYAVSGLLLKSGINASTHKGVRQMFGLHFVQNGLISKELARYFSDLFDRRQSGDYDDFILFDKETAENLVITGREFIKVIEKLIYRG